MSAAQSIERTLRGMLHAAEYAAASETVSAGPGLLQTVDPRIKTAGLLAVIVGAVACDRISGVAAIFAAAALLGLGSGIRLRQFAIRVWLPVLAFTGIIAAPALLMTHRIKPSLFLVLRAETTATVAALLVFTTAWPRVLLALKSLGCPSVMVAILGMTTRYIFLMLRTALDMMESRRSRMIGRLPRAEGRRLAAASAGVLLSRSLRLGDDVHLAMQSRGFRGDVRLMDDFSARPVDWIWLAGFVAAALAAIWWRP